MYGWVLYGFKLTIIKLRRKVSSVKHWFADLIQNLSTKTNNSFIVLRLKPRMRKAGLASLQKTISCADTSASMCIWSKRLILAVPINTLNQLCHGCLSWLNLNRDTFFCCFFPSQTDELAWKASVWQVQVKDGRTIAWETGSCWFYIINWRRARPSGPPVSWEQVIIIGQSRALHTHWLTWRRLNWLFENGINV